VASFDLSSTFVHLGSGGVATELPDFQWTSEYLESYDARFDADGDDGRLVTISPQHETWTTWERHPAGDEIVVCLSGRVDVIQEHDGAEVTISLTPGMAMVNPRGVWHRGVVHEPGDGLFITAGRGTEHKPR
jgi:mannose-6-phosphate isomerase-like protein (cupin superfamily)